MNSYDEVIVSNGVKIPFDTEIITPKIERPLRNSRYEGGECDALKTYLKPGDRVLELGGGIGLLSAVAAMQPGVESVTSIEANPGLIPLIKETHRLNELDNVDLRNGVVSSQAAKDVSFYLRADFWASSMEPDSRRYKSVVEVPNFQLGELIREVNPTVIVCDIEGAENGLFDAQNLSNVRVIILELHPKVYGEETRDAIIKTITRKGLNLVPTNNASTVRTFTRETANDPIFVNPVAPKANTLPRALIATCMKDEGPFILEWVAWHRAMGIQDIIVFSNDCTDGTDVLLDALAEAGEVTHLPNPASALNNSYFQPVALNYLSMMREFKDADYVISMDVDEFIDVGVGDGTFDALISDLAPFDVLSMSELNHGSNGKIDFEPGWVTDLFPNHQTAQPGRQRAPRGVKSIVHNTDKIEKIRNHRPDLKEGVNAVWLDGSGRPLTTLRDDPSANGIDCRGGYEKVVLHHYPLRSLHSYLAKMHRGDVVVKNKQVSTRYWRLRNRDEPATIMPTIQVGRARAYYDDLLKNTNLAKIHDACCKAHAKRIAQLLTLPEFQERKDWVLNHEKSQSKS